MAMSCLLTSPPSWLDWVIFVKLDKPAFIGRDALPRQKMEGPERKLVGIELSDKAIPRHGYAVLKDGQPR